METAKCILCSKPDTTFRQLASLGGETYDIPFYDCPSCGSFLLDLVLHERWTHERDESVCFQLGCVAREHRLRGEKGLFGIFGTKDARAVEEKKGLYRFLSRSWQIDEMLAEFPKAEELIDRALRNLSVLLRDKHPMSKADLPLEDAEQILFCPDSSITDMLQCMGNRGYIVHEPTPDGLSVGIAPEGWERLAELREPNEDSRQVFVAMWFDASMREYEEAIRLGLKDAHFDPCIVKDVEHNNDICDEIVAAIRRSRFVVTDFTAGSCSKCDTCDEASGCKDKVKARGGVYFEAGFAMGLGIPVIWLVRQDQIDQIHFDTRQYNHITYSDPEELRIRLVRRVEATIPSP